MPTLERVAEILAPMRPDLPIPLSTTCPVQAAIMSIASCQCFDSTGSCSTAWARLPMAAASPRRISAMKLASLPLAGGAPEAESSLIDDAERGDMGRLRVEEYDGPCSGRRSR